FPGSSHYTSAHSAPVTFTITKATPTVSVSDDGGIYNGSAFPATPTAAGAIGGAGAKPAARLEGIGVTTTYYVGNDTTGTVLSGAPSQAGTYTMVASFPGSMDYVNGTSAPVTFTIYQATPTITWDYPSAITYGTALGSTQLNATATGVAGAALPGAFSYTPAAGAVLNAGLGQTLS